MRARRTGRGQMLPLAGLSLLFMALMMLISFNVTNVIHEKIRLQNYADAQAFSMGTIEARAFNYLAYSNRASAAGFVTIASLHGYHSVASMAPQLIRAAAVAMFTEMGLEAVVCAASLGSSPCCQHIFTCLQQGLTYMFDDAPDAEDTLTEWEDPFNDAVKGLWDMVGLIHLEQEAMLASTALRLKSGFDGALQTTNRNASPLATGVGGINAYNLYCSTEGSQLDACQEKTQPEERAKLYTEIINASRPKWNHNSLQMGTDYLPLIGQKFSDLSIKFHIFSGGEHAITDDSCNPKNDAKGENACATTPGAMFFGIKEDMPGFGGYTGTEVYSDDSGGDHSPSGAHDGDHDQFPGIPRCVQDKNCFINFRADPEDKKTWGMPSAFAYYQADLSKRPRPGYKTPWTMNDEGRISIELDDNDRPGVLQLKPTRNGAAMSRALVYFHAPGKWARPPNFFDPFWSSKLHPFDLESFEMVINASGDDKSQDAQPPVVIEGGRPE